MRIVHVERQPGFRETVARALDPFVVHACRAEAEIRDAHMAEIEQVARKHVGRQPVVDADARNRQAGAATQQHERLVEIEHPAGFVVGHPRADDQPSTRCASASISERSRAALLGIDEQQRVVVLERDAVRAFHHVREVRVADVEDHEADRARAAGDHRARERVRTVAEPLDRLLSRASTVGEKRCVPFTYFETVATDTPASAATSRIVGETFHSKGNVFVP